MSSFSRRSLFKSAAALAGAAAFSRLTPAFAGTASNNAAQNTLLCIFLDGGYNSLFCSADSFVSGGTFGCTSGNVMDLGNGLVVDSTFGSMPAFAQSHMASVGINHGFTAHEAAQGSLWGDGVHSYPTVLAKTIGGTSAIKAAVVGGAMPFGPTPAEGDVSLQGITDMRATIVALGGEIDNTVPKRVIATKALTESTSMSKKRLLRSPRSLASVQNGYTTGVETLSQGALTLDYMGLCTAYGVAPGVTSVNDFTTQMMAADLMVTAGANVICAIDAQGGWDSHGDTDGSMVRGIMANRILPGLNTFLSRNVTAGGANVTVAIFGDFARSLPGSDHQPNLTATVIGRNVVTGTTGHCDGNVSLAAGSPAIPQFWSYLGAVSRCPGTPFGANPHTAITNPTPA
jgi:hypothetical protein